MFKLNMAPNLRDDEPSIVRQSFDNVPRVHVYFIHTKSDMCKRLLSVLSVRELAPIRSGIARGAVFAIQQGLTLFCTVGFNPIGKEWRLKPTTRTDLKQKLSNRCV